MNHRRFNGLSKLRGQIGGRCEGKPQDKRPIARVFAPEHQGPQGNHTKYNSERQAKVFDARRLAVVMADYFFVSG